MSKTILGRAEGNRRAKWKRWGDARGYRMLLGNAGDGPLSAELSEWSLTQGPLIDQIWESS